jgi:hypothetical protein
VDSPSAVDTSCMTSSIRRGGLALAALALSLVPTSVAQADPGVCNQATAHWLGDGLVALDPPVDSPAARYTVDLGKLPGKGAGLLEAAANSPALTVCEGGGDTVVVSSVDTEPVDVGDGVVSAA